MAWKITKNHIGPTKVQSIDFKAYAEKATSKFRMYDDDGELYFEGVATLDEDFGPLDSYGMPGYGCTEIRYWEKYLGQWSWRTL